MCNHLTYLLLSAVLHHTNYAAIFVLASNSNTPNNVDTIHPLIGNQTLVIVNQTGKSQGLSNSSKVLYNEGERHSTEKATSQVPGNISTVVPGIGKRPAVWKEIQRVCGFYGMCSSEQPYTEYSLMPMCCPRCSCHASCSLANNCCPDLQLEASQPDTCSTCTTLYNILMLAQEDDEQEAIEDKEINDTRSEATVDRHHVARGTTAQETKSTAAEMLNHVKETSTEPPWPRQNNDRETAATDTDNMERFATDTSAGDTGQVRGQQQTNANKADLVNGTKAVKSTKDKHNNLYIKDSAEPVEKKQTIVERTNVDMESNNVRATNKLYAKYVVVASCPPDFKKTAIIEKCLRKNSTFTRDLIPVMDIATVKIYKNAFCAQCHGIINYMHMDIVTTCTKLYLLDSIPVHFKDFRKVTQDCLAYIDPTTYIQAESQICNTVLNDNSAINQCNITGLWDSYDPYTETMCVKGEHMASYSDRSTGPAASYKNIYCYMCNTRAGISKTNTCHDSNYIKQKSTGKDI